MFDSPRFHPSLQQLPRVATTSPDTRERDVEIGGSFDGTFDGRFITVLAGATVSGDLTVDTIEILGVVRGRLRAKSIVLRSTGLIEGEMTYDVLSADPGAIINARCVPA